MIPPRRLTIACIILLGWLAAGCGGKPETPAAPVTLTIYHFNDYHAAWRSLPRVEVPDRPLWSGAAVIGGWLAAFRKDDPECLVIFGGDMFLATPFDRRDEGATTVKILNQLRPDAAAVGNHEFDYGRDRLLALARQIEFPLLAANVRDADGGVLFADTAVIEKHGLRILCLGLFPVNGKRYYEQDHDLRISDALPALKKAIGATAGDFDLTVVIAHLGRDEEEKLAKALPAALGVDLIVGAHSHTVVEELDPALPMPVVQAGANGEYIGKLVVTVDPNTNRLTGAAEYELIPTYAAKVTPDPAIERLIAPVRTALAPVLEPIATTTEPLSNADRIGETPLGNFAADALVDQFGVDLAFWDSKGLRRYIPGPEISENDVREVFPFGNELVKLKLTGAGLRELLGYYAGRDDRYLHLPYTLAVTVSGTGRRTRIEEVRFQGRPVRDDQSFTVVVDSLLAGTWERNYGAENLGVLAEDAAGAFIEYLKKVKVYQPRPGNRRTVAVARRDAA